MPDLTNMRRGPATTLGTLLIAAIAIACLGLTACGDTSSSTSPAKAASNAAPGAPTAATTTPATTTKPSATATVPTTHPTTTTPPATATTPPAATTSTGRAPSNPETVRYRQVLTLLTACIRQHGIKVPPPSASGKLDTKGVDTKSPQFKQVVKECLLTLSRAGSPKSGSSG